MEKFAFFVWFKSIKLSGAKIFAVKFRSKRNKKIKCSRESRNEAGKKRFFFDVVVRGKLENAKFQRLFIIENVGFVDENVAGIQKPSFLMRFYSLDKRLQRIIAILLTGDTVTVKLN